MTQPRMQPKFQLELKRKLFHISGVIFPIIYLFLSKTHMCLLLLVMTGTAIYTDISRHYDPMVKSLITKLFDSILRPEEKSNNLQLSGASYMAIGFLLTALLFAKALAITAWMVLVIADSGAAIVGMRYGLPLANGKSFLGAIVFFVLSVLTSILTYFVIGNYNTSFLIIVISSAITAVVEFFARDIHLNDNIAIPLAYALSTSILGLMV